MNRRSLASVIAIALAAGLAAKAAEPKPSVPADVSKLLTTYCASCHGPSKQEAGVRLDQLSSLGGEAFAGVLSRANSALELREMPPEDARQPSPAERTRLLSWVREQARATATAQEREKLRLPRFGNYVSHESLFSGPITEKASTPARRWLVSPQIFHERVLDVFGLEGKEREVASRGLFGVTNPFVLSEHSGVRYYDLGVLDGGHLLVMLGNADWIAGKQIWAARVKSGEVSAAAIENPKDKWFPKTVPPAFEAIVLMKSAPTEAEMTAAVQTQFQCVLRRAPTDAEQQEYVKLLRKAIELAGNAEGLRHMLRTVLLESEFLYRLEFGGGKPDEFGRRLLTPREASYAIAYALGDRGPDAALERAAREGRLTSREDFRREVTRLLADPNYLRGPVDPGISGMHIHSHVTSHPKVIRFFREFFGYAAALKVFKDIPRSGGYYRNPDRGHTGTPGWLIQEADELVIWCVDQDRRVFENLLTTDRYFVYHNMNAEAGRKLIAQWKNVYDTLKSTPWKTDPVSVMAQHQQLLVAAQIIDNRQKDLSKHNRAFLFHMYYFQDTFGRGTTPFTRGPFTHGYTYEHSQIYNLPALPTRGRYEGVDTPRYKERKDKTLFWDYPLEQPFQIPNRKGILTHPAWLIAHSQNSATDPVRRGLWVREKLLAGYVPEVPITVDAQIPEDPHRTLRERLDSVTGKAECRRCHQHMNPLGVTFEMYDDFGRHRREESLEYAENLISRATVKDGADTYKTKPVNTAGRLSGTGDPKLDGDVADALELIDRLSRSERVRQSIIRHAFRYFLGRNETVADAQTLRDADRAYVESGGSFRAVIVSLLTSDSFLYRK